MLAGCGSDTKKRGKELDAFLGRRCHPVSPFGIMSIVESRDGDGERRVLNDRVDALTEQTRIDQDVIAHLQAEGLIDHELISNLRDALTTSRLIGAAIGIVMHATDVDQEIAFGVLVRFSQAENVKLSQIAARIVRTKTINPDPT